jgi:hypothetical protein
VVQSGAEQAHHQQQATLPSSGNGKAIPARSSPNGWRSSPTVGPRKTEGGESGAWASPAPTPGNPAERTGLQFPEGGRGTDAPPLTKPPPPSGGKGRPSLLCCAPPPRSVRRDYRRVALGFRLPCWTFSRLLRIRFHSILLSR